MSRGFSGAVLKGLRARDYTLTLLTHREVAPHFRRFRFSAPGLFEAVEWQPAAWLRFWFPDPAGSRREFQRAYTLVTADPARDEFEVDVLMHQPPGPATRWFAQAKPGDQLPSTFYGSRFRLPQPEPAGYLLLGDACATPALNTILGAVSANTAVELYLEYHTEADWQIPLSSHPQLQVQRIQRRGPAALAEAIAARPRPGWYAWAAGESASMKAVHKALKEAHGFGKSEMYVQSYWLEETQ